MAENYKLETESWVFGEIKQTIIGLYVVFKEKLAHYMLSINGLSKDSYVGKAELISATYGFYGAIMKGFDEYLVKTKDKTEINSEDYKKLLISKVNEIDDEKLREMCYHLERYHSYFGHGNLTLDRKVYDNIVDQLADENEI